MEITPCVFPFGLLSEKTGTEETEREESGLSTVPVAVDEHEASTKHKEEQKNVLTMVFIVDSPNILR